MDNMHPLDFRTQKTWDGDAPAEQRFGKEHRLFQDLNSPVGARTVSSTKVAQRTITRFFSNFRDKKRNSRFCFVFSVFTSMLRWREISLILNKGHWAITTITKIKFFKLGWLTIDLKISHVVVIIGKGLTRLQLSLFLFRGGGILSHHTLGSVDEFRKTQL